MSNIILGGGISGLSVGYYLSKAGKDGIKIFESSNRLGGWIRTTRNENGTVFEHGPRTLRYSGIAAENTLELVEDLGLSSSIRSIPKTNSAAKNRMIYYNNEIINLPTSWTALFKINPPFVRPFIFGLLKDLTTPKKLLVDESIHNFVARRFGEEYAEIVVSAMICGIFAGDAKEISVRALMNDLFENEQKYGSVILGLIKSFKKKPRSAGGEKKNWALWSFENGLETLPNHLEKYLREQNNVEVCLGRKCTKVEFKNGKVFLTVDEKVEAGDHLYSSLPSKNLAKILGEEHSFLRNELSAIPFVSVVVVNLEYAGDVLDKKGFGFLVPPNQNLPILGVTFDTCIFPQEGKTVLTVMMGGRWFEHHFGLHPNEENLLKTAQHYVKNILGINKTPSGSMVTILRECIPQYTVGHSARIQRIRGYISAKGLPLTLAGNSFDGVGVNDAILSAKTGVESSLRRVPT